MKTYTIRNEARRRSRKIDNIDIVRNNPPELPSKTHAPDSTPSVQKPEPTTASVLGTVPPRRPVPVHVPIPVPNCQPESEKSQQIDENATIIDSQPSKPLKPILKPAAAVLNDTQAYTRRSTYPPYRTQEKSLRNIEKDLPTPNISPASSKSYRSTDRIIRSKSVDLSPDARPRRVSIDKNKFLFYFTCLKPRKKTTDTLPPSFRVINTRVSDYNDPHKNPIPTPPKPRQPTTTSKDDPILRYKFLYPPIPENIPDTANNFLPVSSRTPTPAPKSKKSKPSKRSKSETTAAPPYSAPPPNPLPPRRVVKKLSSHLSRHPAIKGLMSQYPTVEMYEKRTGFDSYFDTPFIEYSHSYWTSLNRPPSPLKRTKPLKVKFETPVTKTSRVPVSAPAPPYLETYGPRRDLGADVNLADEYSYPYSPEDYDKRFPYGFARDSIEEVALLGGRRFSSQTDRYKRSGKYRS